MKKKLKKRYSGRRTSTNKKGLKECFHKDEKGFWDFINFFYLEEKLLIIFAEKSRYTLLILIEESIGKSRK